MDELAALGDENDHVVKDPNYLQCIELERIRQSAGVVPDSVFMRSHGGVDYITFAIATEPTVAPPAADIRDIEAIHFVYKDGRVIGETAPYSVVCDRMDFPRNIGHLCAGEPGCPAAPCLALGGTQPIYERGGIEAILVRLRDFLRDAKTGSLMVDGWEPVPFAVGEKLRLGELNARFFQELAAAMPDARHAFGAALTFEDKGQQYVSVSPQAIEAADLPAALAFHNGNNGNLRRAIPWIFVWSDPARSHTEPMFESWRNARQLREGLRPMGLEAPYDAAIGQLLITNGIDFRFHRQPLSGKAMVLIVGLRRPVPILPNFYGYSDNPGARGLELRALYLSRSIEGTLLEDDTEVETIIGHHPPEPGLLRWVAGVPAFSPAAMIGLGALGSAICDDLMRSGMDDAVLWDNDTVSPHNLARHTARLPDLYSKKVEVLKIATLALSRDPHLNISHIEEDFAATPDDQIIERVQDRLLIDATADERVRSKLDDLKPRLNTPLVRTEMFHEGRLGVTFVSQPGGPLLADMMLALIASAPNNQAVASWLEFEDLHPFGTEPLFYGFGCTSATVHLPNHVVRQHASVSSNLVCRGETSSGILLNPLDEGLMPVGTHWISVEPFATLIPPGETGWEVKIAPGAMAHLQSERKAALPNETGGYLYGNWEPSRRRITILYASPQPPESNAGTARLELGPAGALPEERRFLRKTRGRLYLCGTWHSHPVGSASMSTADEATISAHAQRDAGDLRPTLMVIAGEEDMQAHLRLPQ